MHPEILRRSDMKREGVVLATVASDQDFKAIDRQCPVPGRALLGSFPWRVKWNPFRSDTLRNREPGIPILDCLQSSNALCNCCFAAMHFCKSLCHDLFSAPGLLLALEHPFDVFA